MSKLLSGIGGLCGGIDGPRAKFFGGSFQREHCGEGEIFHSRPILKLLECCEEYPIHFLFISCLIHVVSLSTNFRDAKHYSPGGMAPVPL